MGKDGFARRAIPLEDAGAILIILPPNSAAHLSEIEVQRGRQAPGSNREVRLRMRFYNSRRQPHGDKNSLSLDGGAFGFLGRGPRVNLLGPGRVWGLFRGLLAFART